MEEEAILEKLKKIAMLRWGGRPEENRDFEALSHYFIFIWDKDKCDEEYSYRQTKATVIDMWFEGKFVMKDHICLEDLKVTRKIIKQYEDDEEDEEGGEGIPLPPEDDKTRKAKTIYIT